MRARQTQFILANTPTHTISENATTPHFVFLHLSSPLHALSAVRARGKPCGASEPEWCLQPPPLSEEHTLPPSRSSPSSFRRPHPNTLFSRLRLLPLRAPSARHPKRAIRSSSIQPLSSSRGAHDPRRTAGRAPRAAPIRSSPTTPESPSPAAAAHVGSLASAAARGRCHRCRHRSARHTSTCCCGSAGGPSRSTARSRRRGCGCCPSRCRCRGHHHASRSSAASRAHSPPRDAAAGRRGEASRLARRRRLPHWSRPERLCSKRPDERWKRQPRGSVTEPTRFAADADDGGAVVQSDGGMVPASASQRWPGAGGGDLLRAPLLARARGPRADARRALHHGHQQEVAAAAVVVPAEERNQQPAQQRARRQQQRRRSAARCRPARLAERDGGGGDAPAGDKEGGGEGGCSASKEEVERRRLLRRLEPERRMPNTPKNAPAPCRRRVRSYAIHRTRKSPAQESPQYGAWTTNEPS